MLSNKKRINPSNITATLSRDKWMQLVLEGKVNVEDVPDAHRFYIKDALQKQITPTLRKDEEKFLKDREVSKLTQDLRQGRISVGDLPPAHFAPSSLKSGYKMIDKLSASTDPTVFAVTPDLASMLGKKNFVKIGTMPQPFGNEIVEKTLMVNPATSAEDLFGTSFLEDSGETMQSFLDGLKNSGLSLYPKNGKHYFTDQNNPLYKEPPIILHKNGGHLKRK